ncbi:MAG: class I SAM-dependent methyltransferase [Clostridia bacterium]|nr:class I SAM-dependent methyltransferase [Clostridia bacterium]
MKYHIESNSVQETLVIPLYGRKICTELYPNVFKDEKAVELIEKIDYDFSVLEKNSSGFAYRFGALEVAMREGDLLFEIKDYLSLHPKASVVNMGCGLDQTAENCDNGQCKIYNLDLPDVIAARNALLPSTDRIKNIACDLNDTAWFNEIDSEYGVIFISAGVFYYFKRADVKKLFTAMEARFKSCRICFDTANKRAVKIMLKTFVKQAGVTSIKDYFYVSDPKNELTPWFEKAKVSSRGYMLGYNDLKDKSIPKTFRFLSKIADWFMKMQIVKIEL